MFLLSVFRFKNEGTPREKCFCRDYHYKTVKGLCRALRRLSWNTSFDHAQVWSDDFNFHFYVSFGTYFERDFSELKKEIAYDYKY